ncbi:MAG: acetyl-CoA carboxylase biotin carboxyl carrier protein subunit [Deltaproteobacteria bacterium]|nr:acetyl-CoA carboxylase biotin carboxyl carrier protein subunit [Deltaproteobacteria bacterium]
MDLTEDDVLEILNLIEKSSFDFLQLQMGDLKLVVSKGGYMGSAPVAAFSDPQPAAGPAVSSEPAPKAREAEVKTQAEQPQPKAKAVVRDGTVPIMPINAPMVGTFYITPEPGAPPFVEVGGNINEDTTVGLIEVMKVFNAIKSGVRGVVEEICVQGGQFVEYGQTVMLVKPKGKG